MNTCTWTTLLNTKIVPSLWLSFVLPTLLTELASCHTAVRPMVGQQEITKKVNADCLLRPTCTTCAHAGPHSETRIHWIANLITVVPNVPLHPRYLDHRG